MLREKGWFIAWMLRFLILSIVALLLVHTGEEIVFFSENRSFWADVFFRNFTKMGEEYVYYVLVIFFLFIRFRFAIALGVTGFCVTVVAYALKTIFGHPRPASYFFKLELKEYLNAVDGVKLHVGNSSFPSGHTMSAFALYGFLALAFHSKRYQQTILFFMAFFVGLSRIYLVQHFLKDVVFGAMIGLCIALSMSWLFRVKGQEKQILDASILELWKNKT